MFEWSYTIGRLEGRSACPAGPGTEVRGLLGRSRPRNKGFSHRCHGGLKFGTRFASVFGRELRNRGGCQILQQDGLVGGTMRALTVFGMKCWNCPGLERHRCLAPQGLQRAGKLMRIGALVICSLFGLSAHQAWAKIYVFVDERGVPHYSNAQHDARYREYKPPSRISTPRSPRLPAGGGRTGAEFLGEIERAGRVHGVDPALIAAIIRVESDFCPEAVSAKGAQGLMQLMPATATRFAAGDPFDPRDNIDAGVRYLAYLLRLFNGDLPLVLAAYNAGEHKVLQHGGVPPYPETRAYVRRVLAGYAASRGRPAGRSR